MSEATIDTKEKIVISLEKKDYDKLNKPLTLKRVNDLSKYGLEEGGEKIVASRTFCDNRTAEIVLYAENHTVMCYGRLFSEGGDLLDETEYSNLLEGEYHLCADGKNLSHTIAIEVIGRHKIENKPTAKQKNVFSLVTASLPHKIGDDTKVKVIAVSENRDALVKRMEKEVIRWWRGDWSPDRDAEVEEMKIAFAKGDSWKPVFDLYTAAVVCKIVKTKLLA